MSSPLRIGILGAAAIAPAALVRPAREVEGAVVQAVAARDPRRARAFAKRHGIPDVHSDYDALLADSAVDAVYNPLPNGLHKEWSLRALAAGKAVLCEKPIAANADEAEEMRSAAEAAGLPLMEAFHYRYHPLTERTLAILGSGEIGALEQLSVDFHVPLWKPGDIRFRPELAGGSAMDLGCYAIHWVRTMARAEPKVVSARARLLKPQLDRWIAAELRFDDGRTARIRCSMVAARLPAIQATARGSAGDLRVTNFVAPQFFHRLRVRGAQGARHERVPGPASYTGQLEAFVARVREGRPVPTEGQDMVSNMRVIDAIYRAAGLKRRGD